MALVRRPLKSDNAPLNWTVAARDVVCPRAVSFFLKTRPIHVTPASLCHAAVTPPSRHPPHLTLNVTPTLQCSSHVTHFTSHLRYSTLLTSRYSRYTPITVFPSRYTLHTTSTLSSSFFAYFLVVPLSQVLPSLLNVFFVLFSRVFFLCVCCLCCLCCLTVCLVTLAYLILIADPYFSLPDFPCLT